MVLVVDELVELPSGTTVVLEVVVKVEVLETDVVELQDPLGP